jgi:hypothetical protein
LLSIDDDDDDDDDCDDDDDGVLGDETVRQLARLCRNDTAARPPYVAAVDALLRERHSRRRIVAVVAVVRLLVRRGHKPSVAYSLYAASGAQPRHVLEAATILSLRVVAQRARALPIDVALRLWQTPRPYIVRAGVDVLDGLDEELVTDGFLVPLTRYSEPTLACCALDAAGFERSSAGIERRRMADGLELVSMPRRARHAPLVRALVTTATLERVHPVARDQARRAAHLYTPLDGSDVTVYTNARALDDALGFVETSLRPHAERTLGGARPRFATLPLTLDSWVGAAALAIPGADVWQATLTCVLHLALQ